MTSRNEITGEMIAVGAEPDSDLYDRGWERIFGKKAPPITPEQEAFKRKLMDRMEPIEKLYRNTICDVCTRAGCTECQRDIE